MNNKQTIGFLCQSLAFWSNEQTAAARHAIDRGCVDWGRIFNYAAYSGIAPALYYALNTSGLLAHVPDQETEFFCAAWSLNRQRNRMMLQVLTEASGQLNAVGITPLLLKGAVALLPDQYEGAFDRMMGDLDLLMPAGRTKEAHDILKQHGYIPLSDGDEDYDEAYWESVQHDVPLQHPDLPVKIELHRTVLAPNYRDVLENMEELAWRNAKVRQEQGASMAVPDPTFRVLHNFAHQRLVNGQFARNEMSLRCLYEFVQLCRSADIHYSWLVDYLTERKLSAPWEAYCLCARRLFAQPLQSRAGIYARYKDAQLLIRSYSERLSWACLLPEKVLIRVRSLSR